MEHLPIVCVVRTSSSPERDMAVREQPPETRDYPAEKARQGEIILRKPWQRAVFIAGLAGAVILALVARILGAW
jgi:hypothetical protein